MPKDLSSFSHMLGLPFTQNKLILPRRIQIDKTRLLHLFHLNFVRFIFTHYILILEIINLMRGKKMKQKSSLVLDEEDGKVVQLFAGLGMPKNLAKTLTYISQVDECRSAEVEQGADLRQPEVSMAMQELRRRGWAKKRDLKKKGKGRPVHIYKLTKPLPQILKNFEQDKMKEVHTIRSDLADLQSLIKEYKK